MLFFDISNKLIKNIYLIFRYFIKLDEIILYLVNHIFIIFFILFCFFLVSFIYYSKYMIFICFKLYVKEWEDERKIDMENY
jgi:hypothetical protein